MQNPTVDKTGLFNLFEELHARDVTIGRRENPYQAYLDNTKTHLKENKKKERTLTLAIPTLKDRGIMQTRKEHNRPKDERAFAFCLEVLASAGSMPLTAMSALLAPWGWTCDTLVERMAALQAEGLVILTDVPTSKKRFTPHVRMTPAGVHATTARDFGYSPSPNTSPANETQQRRIQSA